MQIMPTGSGAGLQPDPYFNSVKLLIQPHKGDVGINGIYDRGPDKRVPTLENGSVTIVDNHDRSPIHGAYADPGTGCRISFSDDAGLIPATSSNFTIEAIVQPESASLWAHGLFGAGASDVARHFQVHAAPSSNYFYGYDGAQRAIYHDNFDADDAYSTTGPAQNFTVQVEGSYVCMWWNGHPLRGATENHNVASNDWSVGWSKFLLFQDVPGGSDFFGNLIAFRYTSLSRFTLGTAFIPNVWGFPENG